MWYCISKRKYWYADICRRIKRLFKRNDKNLRKLIKYSATMVVADEIRKYIEIL
ncbi:hypothetical protein HUN03_00487 [Mycoplasmopsis anatis]